jgi:TRAP-type C4-dicarboxylate transport system substrate-binding protein
VIPTEGVSAVKLFIVALAAALLIVGCGGSGSDDKAAKTSQPVVLRVGTDDEPGKPAADQILKFARTVEALSGGSLKIQPAWHAAGDGPNWDQRVARMVEKNEIEMGLIPSRAWDTEGVTSLQALNAPFLITSDELLDNVVSSQLAGQLMAGLGAANVHGLALIPEGLRHPFATHKALMGPSDYSGQTLRSPTSKTTAEVFKALGARVNDDELDPSEHAAAESSYVLDPNGTATGNVTFFPKVNSLVISDAAYDKLSDEQRDVLAKAAAQTRGWAVERTPTDTEAAQTWCHGGRSIVLASPSQLDALQQAAAPVTRQLEQNGDTARLIAAIRELGQGIAAPAPAACGAATRSGSDNARINGVYRFTITDRQLRGVGITDAADVAENHGTFTVTVKDGGYCWKQTAANPLNNPDECSTYQLDGRRLVWNFPTGEPDVYRVKQTTGGDLELTAVSSAELAYAKAWAANTWVAKK